MSQKAKATEEDDYEEETFNDSHSVVDESADLDSQKAKEREVTSLLSRLFLIICAVSLTFVLVYVFFFIDQRRTNHMC